ncbi:aldehyde dehydrogenase family protein, partial [Dietzia sp.]|uniref:aldehyde dehydrogenase family protein n=1 Tax=Dietzia sp. TaxID=1871616 RepID=UPI002FD90888
SVVVPVGAETADKLVEKIAEKTKQLKVGHSFDSEADYGPLVTSQAKDNAVKYIDAGEKEGATLVVDGRGKGATDSEFEGNALDEGYFLGPTLFDNVTKDMSIYTEEIFGPVLSVVRAENFEEALALPSEHMYGNGVAIFTRDGDTAREFVDRVEVGMVGVNVPIPVPIAYHTFGGWKKSGFGDLNQHGPESIKFYSKVKTVTQRWPSGVKEGASFIMPTMD